MTGFPLGVTDRTSQLFNHKRLFPGTTLIMIRSPRGGSMIIRVFDNATEHLSFHQAGPAGVRGTFGKIEVLQFASTQLHQLFGIALADTDVDNAFALAAALARHNDRPTKLKRRNDRLARLVQQRAYLLPCFIGYQETPEEGLLPFMTDGPSGRWSLFFEGDGRMTLVEHDGSSLILTADDALHGPPISPPVAPAPARGAAAIRAAMKLIRDARLVGPRP